MVRRTMPKKCIPIQAGKEHPICVCVIDLRFIIGYFLKIKRIIRLVGRTIGVRTFIVCAADAMGVDAMAVVVFPFMSPMRIQCNAAKEFPSRDSLQPCVEERELGNVSFFQILGYPDQKFFW